MVYIYLLIDCNRFQAYVHLVRIEYVNVIMSYLYYVNICGDEFMSCRWSPDFHGLDLRTSWSLFSGAGHFGEAWLILASGCGTWWKKYMKSYDSLWMLIQCLSDTGSGLMFTDSEFGGRPFACSTLTCSSGAAIAKSKTLHGSICKLYYPEKQKLLFLQRNRKSHQHST